MAFTPWDNPMGTDGFEFIEFAAPEPAALGKLFVTMGFTAVAKHRHKNVTLYRQGGVNFLINAETDSFAQRFARLHGPSVCAIAFRVKNAARAYKRALSLGAWGVENKVGPMELNIPAIHGVGTSRIYFVDRWEAFSIWDVDFVPIPTVDRQPPAIAGLHWFGLVQYIGTDRMADWSEFYRELFGFDELPDEQRFGILPKGRILRSPCPAGSTFYLQLIEPDASVLEVEGEESLQRIGLGCPDVLAAVAELGRRGVEFIESRGVHTEGRGALTRTWLGSVSFELVHNERPGAC